MWPTGVGEFKTQVDTSPARSHAAIFIDVWSHAKAIVEMTATIPHECIPPHLLPTNRLDELIELLANAAMEATLPEGFQWGDDAMEAFNFGKSRAYLAMRKAFYEWRSHDP
jgi:hypothetical protein